MLYVLKNAGCTFHAAQDMTGKRLAPELSKFLQLVLQDFVEAAHRHFERVEEFVHVEMYQRQASAFISPAVQLDEQWLPQQYLHGPMGES